MPDQGGPSWDPKILTRGPALRQHANPPPPEQDLGLVQLDSPTTPTPGAVLSGGKLRLPV